MAEITGIDVHPSDESNVLPVAVKQIGAFYYPVYLSAVGEDGEIASADNPVPIDGTEIKRLADKVSELVTIQQSMIDLMRAVFEDGLSGANEQTIEDV